MSVTCRPQCEESEAMYILQLNQVNIKANNSTCQLANTIVYHSIKGACHIRKH